MDHIKSELEEIATLCKSVDIKNNELEKEINSLIHSADDVVVLLYSRRCLEVMMTDICETTLNRERGTEPMKGILDKIFKEKIVPAFISTAMQNVNNNSTYGAHPKDFDKRQVRSTLIDLATILDWYFFDFKKLEKKATQSSTPKTEKVESEKTTGQPEKVVSGTSQKKGVKQLYIIIAIVLVIVAGLIIYLISGKETTGTVGEIAKNKDTLSGIANKKDTVAIVNTTNTPEKIQAAISETSKEEQSVQPAASSTSAVKPLDLPEDLENALNMLMDKSANTGRKLASIPVLTKRFTADAEVNQLNDKGFFLEGFTVKGYLTKIITNSSLYQIKVVSTEKEGDKIKVLKVEHVKK